MNYGKAIAAIVATVLTALVAAMVGDAIITVVEWVNVAIAGTGAAAVFAAPNVPGAKYTKSVLAVLTGVLMLLTSVITDGITSTEWMQLALAALGALGVYAAPYVPPNRLRHAV
jgi:hypothetical protein